MSLDERWVLRSPEAMAEGTIADVRERFEMVVEDLLAMSTRGIVADGFGLLPELITPVLSESRRAIFLIPTPDFRAQALAQRGWGNLLDETSDPAWARQNKLRRDQSLAEYVRRTAADRGPTVLEIDGRRSLTEVAALVEHHFLPHLPATLRKR